MEELLNLDNQILNYIALNIKNGLFDVIMPIFSIINNHGEVWLLIALILLLSKDKTIKLTGITMFLALALTYLLGDFIIKDIIARARPTYNIENYQYLIKLPTSYSFPSGHSASSFASFGVLWFMNNKYKFAALVLAFAIAFSRMYVHVHYPSDVIGGIVLGLLCARVVVNMIKKFIINTK